MRKLILFEVKVVIDNLTRIQLREIDYSIYKLFISKHSNKLSVLKKHTIKKNFRGGFQFSIQSIRILFFESIILNINLSSGSETCSISTIKF